MKIKSILMAGCIGASVIALASCSTASKSAGGAPVSDATAGTSTSGLGDQGGFQGGGYGSSLKAPANQSYYFDLNKNNVHQSDYASIAAQGKYLASHPKAKIRVEGNCDNRGSREYNVALGWRRANAVKGILMQYGVKPTQVTTFSWGSEKPIAFGDNEQAWAKNRRVDLIYKAY